MSDTFVIAGVELGSRLILGTGGAPSLQVIDETLRASGTAMCTVAAGTAGGFSGYTMARRASRSSIGLTVSKY